MSTAAADPFPPSSSSSSGFGAMMETLNRIDMNKLSQSELQALSSRSNSSFGTDDVVSPHIDRSLFNESAGSRKQTYSRLHSRSHFRLTGVHSPLKPHQNPQQDPVNHSIVHYLKHFLNGNHDPPPPPPIPIPIQQQLDAPAVQIASDSTKLGFLGFGENLGKRKRALKSNTLRLLENGAGIELQKVDKNGKVVDFDELDVKGDDLLFEELKRRTVGLETEEGVLGFLWGLEGEWCSTRKKRKFVDAGMFGQVLPVGWKILLGIRRRGFRPSVYCRRFISPTGQQFLSCKEVATFLKSYFGGSDVDQPRDQKTCSIQQAYDVSTAKTSNVTCELPPQSTLAITPTNARETDDSLMGIENLPEVQVHDIFECLKCNLTFSEKDVYLQHLFSTHQKTTKRVKYGTTVGEGVIIKDGKFECQFCHKVFEERRSYNGHVGVHVRNAGKNSNELIAPVSVQKNDESKMETLTEIGQTSVLETSKVEETIEGQGPSPNISNMEEAKVATGDIEINVGSDPAGIQISNDKINVDSDSVGIQIGNNEINVGSDSVGIQRDDNSQGVMETGNLRSEDYSWDMNVKMDTDGINGINGSLDMDLCLKPSNDVIEDTPGLTVEEIEFPDDEASGSMAQAFQFFPSFDSMSNKEVEHEFSVAGQKLGNATVFEELRFDDLEPLKYDFVHGDDLQSLTGGSMNLGNGVGIENGFNSSVAFGSDEIMLNSLDLNQLTTLCVWCRSEFKLEGVESESPSDSIGYMCPTCKAKISGHLDGF